MRCRFEKTKKAECSITWPPGPEDGAREYIARYCVDERAPVDEQCGDVPIASQTPQQQIPRRPAPVGEVGMKREAPQTKISAVRVRSSVFARGERLHKTAFPRGQWCTELVGDLNDVVARTMFGDQNITLFGDLVPQRSPCGFIHLSNRLLGFQQIADARAKRRDTVDGPAVRAVGELRLFRNCEAANGLIVCENGS